MNAGKPIDVLAAIDLGAKAINHLPATDTLLTATESLTPSEAWERIHAARAAVVELIEAASDPATRILNPPLRGPKAEQIVAARARLRAALARVGGASHA